MTEHDLGHIMERDPDIARALAIFSNAKKEASSLVSGDDEKSIVRRNQLQSGLIRELVERSGLNIQNGKSSTDREIFEAGEAAL
jgi:hypothetical protein